MKVRIKFRKNGSMKFIGHLDIMRYFQKAIRRAELPVAYSGGYSPHMIMSFANPLGVGLTSDGESVDIELQTPISSDEAVKRLNAAMAEEMEVLSFVEIPEDRKNKGMTLVAAADYLAFPVKGNFTEDLAEKISAFLAQDAILVMKKTKKSEKEVNIRSLIYDMNARSNGIFLKLASGSRENLKPSLVMDAFLKFLETDPETVTTAYHRLELYADAGSEDCPCLVTLESLGKKIP